MLDRAEDSPSKVGTETSVKEVDSPSDVGKEMSVKRIDPQSDNPDEMAVASDCDLKNTSEYKRAFDETNRPKTPDPMKSAEILNGEIENRKWWLLAVIAGDSLPSENLRSTEKNGDVSEKTTEVKKMEKLERVKEEMKSELNPIIGESSESKNDIETISVTENSSENCPIRVSIRKDD
jgi:hypothetical protein